MSERVGDPAAARARKRAQELRDAIPNAVGPKRDQLRWDAALFDQLADEIDAVEERATTAEARALELATLIYEADFYPNAEAAELAVRRAEVRVGVLEDALRRIAEIDPDEWSESGGWRCVRFIKDIAEALRGDKAATE